MRASKGAFQVLSLGMMCIDEDEEDEDRPRPVSQMTMRLHDVWQSAELRRHAPESRSLRKMMTATGVGHVMQGPTAHRRQQPGRGSPVSNP